MSDSAGANAAPNEPKAGGGVAWEHVHDQDASWRKKLVGEISDVFILPRYVRLFYDTFGDGKDQDFIEIGSGIGENSKAVVAANRPSKDGSGKVIRRYLTTEVFQDGVDWLRKQGLEAERASAEELPFPDQSFTAAISFDVMHHVDNPRKMAREMLRVSRGRVLLTESNGLSLPRKLLELTPSRRAAGEQSYTPWRYRSFFENQPGYRITHFMIYPFLFPFKVPGFLLPALVAFNRMIEYIPIVRWQCSSVVIVIDYERVPEQGA
ncbi:MAG TPA: class I SAM-dependent methyltransferase [Planctomycetota bacterium]|nr:class I SAM-dependent methyltransferase [Planctomycetota bacterium]